MKLTFRSITLAIGMLLAASCGQKVSDGPLYLDESQPLDARVEDALSRMTLEEKVKIIHAQSKFSSAGVPRLGIP
ncbi:MAG: glycosyl hydrolase, partial [Bacteroidales bacterium]|nr:glycosyl hydrolase [Bacteroidales bacterium]